jgi:hypothetical protein
MPVPLSVERNQRIHVSMVNSATLNVNFSVMRCAKGHSYWEKDVIDIPPLFVIRRKFSASGTESEISCQQVFTCFILKPKNNTECQYLDIYTFIGIKEQRRTIFANNV